MTLSKHMAIIMIIGAFVVYSVASCGDDDEPRDTTGGDGDTDADADMDADADTDADTDSDSDADLTGVNIMPSGDGWLNNTDNELGIQGAWYTFGCDGATVNPAEGTPFTNTGKMCFSGTAPAVTDANGDGELDWSDIWGAGMGFDVCANADTDTPPEQKNTMGECPFNPNLETAMTGVSVKFSGTVNAEHLRIQFNEGDSVANSYYIVNPADVTAGVVQNVRFEDELVATHYNTALKPDGAVAANILAIQFQVPTNQSGPVDWNFCVEAIAALTD